jgi:hypothetical protein
MKHLAALIIILSFQSTFAQQQSQTFSQSGSLYFFPYYSMNAYRFTNVDGNLAKFDGDGYGVRLGFKPFPNWFPGLSLTADFASGKSENDTDKNEELEYSSITYGISQYMNRFLYIGGKYGENKIKIKNDLIETKLNPDYVGVLLGLDVFQIGSSFSLTLEAQYNKGFSEKTKNTNAAYNSGFDGVEYRVGIRWAPSVSFTVPGR